MAARCHDCNRSLLVDGRLKIRAHAAFSSFEDEKGKRRYWCRDCTMQNYDIDDALSAKPIRLGRTTEHIYSSE